MNVFAQLYRIYFIQVDLVQGAGARQQRGALPMGEGDLLAGEQTGVLGVVAHEHREGGIAGHAQRKRNDHFAGNGWIGNGQLAGVFVFVLDGR